MISAFCLAEILNHYLYCEINEIMVNRSQKEQILKQLERHYISPLSQFHIETEVLKRVMLGRPFRVQIGMLDSWRIQRFYQKMQPLTQEDALARLWLFDEYLKNSENSVFAHDSTLILGDSFPYFEWQKADQMYGLNQLLGIARIFYFYKGNEESAGQFCEFMTQKGIANRAVVVGEVPESLLKDFEAANILHITHIPKPFFENIGKGRGFTNLFSQVMDILLMDRRGCYVKSFSRAEFIRQIDHLIETYL